MSDIGAQMFAELRRIRDRLEGEQALGFGKKVEPVYVVFIRHSAESLWYTRDKRIAENVLIAKRDLTGYLKGVWRYDRIDQGTQEQVAKLMIQVQADREYIIQSGFETNFSKSFLAGLLELPTDAVHEPITLLVEDNAGGRGRPTVFARLEWRGSRLKPSFDRTVNSEEQLEAVQGKFGFCSPFGSDNG